MRQHRFEVPAAVTLIDRPMIEASGAREIADLLRLVPGFQAYHVNGHKFGVTAHGLGAPHPGRLEIMVDGRSVYLPSFSSVDWRALGIGIADIERIEVARGPAVTTWGSNAFQGAVNIITRNPVAFQGTRAIAQGGSADSARLELSHSQQLETLSLRTSAGYRDSDGFEVNDDGESGYFGLRGVMTPSLRDTLDLQLGFSGGHHGVGDAFSDINRRDFKNFYQSLSWRRDLMSGGELQLNAHHNYLDYEMETWLLSEGLGIPPATLAALGVPDEPIIANLEHGASRRYDLELQHTFTPHHGLRVLWGAGARLDKGKSSAVFSTRGSEQAWFWRAFGNLEWKPAPRWVWNLGAMLEHSKFTETELSPRLGLNYRLAPAHTLRASYTLAHRAPSLVEARQDSRLFHSNGTQLLWLRHADPSLGAETNRALELGYLGQWPSRDLELDLKLFWEQIRDGIGRATLIDAQAPLFSQVDPSSNVNNADWDTRGLEVEARYRPSAGRWLALAYSYLELDGGMTPGPLDDPANPIFDFDDRGPRHNLALLGSQQLGQNYRLSAALYRQSDVDWIGGSDLTGYTRLDLRLARQLRLGRSDASIALLVQNLGGEYAEFHARNRFDTRAYLTLYLSLH
nr:TonB-dependent receptor [Motiliproteus sp. SC1-56]